MILTLPWKEFREHRSIWLTMVVMTAVLGLGLARIVAGADFMLATSVSALTVLGMGGAYGVVCGAMMLAGEHEGGTLVFLDIFLGRRYLLWIGKFLIGIGLVLAEALAVALAIFLMQQGPPTWAPALVGGIGDAAVRLPGLARWGSGPEIWFLVLPVVTLEAYAWGLLGSSLTRRVLAGAAVATGAATPIWLTLICLPAPAFFVVRLLAAGVVLIVSFSHFITQAREASAGPAPTPDEKPDPRARFIELAEEFDRKDAFAYEEQPALEVPTVYPVVVGRAARENGQPSSGQAATRRRRKVPQADSPSEVLWWLTFQQAWVLLCILAAASLVAGFIVPANAQVLWPLATLLLGVACGTAVFAPEQRDLSYEFLSAQHFPLHAIWRFKIVFWLSGAVVAAVMMALAGALVVLVRFVAGRGAAAPVFQLGTLPEVMGPILFFGIWLAYGFCAGTVVVWYCRKNVLALLLAGMVSAAGLGLWLPSVLCRGMGGWQLWLPPLALLAAGHYLVRAWAGGRIKERKPVAALIGLTLGVALWAGLNFGYRAWEIPNVGEPLDPLSFKAAIPSGKENAGGTKVQEALAEMERPEDLSLERIAEAARLPVGVIEVPRGDGQPPSLRLLPACRKLTARLRDAAQKNQPDINLEYLDQILALSRNMRNRAPIEFYLAGVDAEESALEGLDRLLMQGKPSAKVLRRALEALNRHADETPSALDCLQTECYRAGGLQANPVLWTFAMGGPEAPGKIPEPWMARGVALSLEMPWEDERKTRLWQAVWAGLFRGVQTPHWQRPERSDPPATKDTTRRILRGWLPANEGSGASLTAARLARLLDASWLSDERLFCAVPPLRAAANRSQCRVAAWRQAVALALYQSDEGRPAKKLDDLVPKYLAKLPVDPYSGEAFHYRVSLGEHVLLLGNVRPGQAIVWSTGPDRVDHGGHQHGGHLAEDDADWSRDRFDVVTLAPNWP